MKIETVEQKENPLLKRKELTLKLDYEGAATPSKKAVSDELAKTLSVPAENVEIRTLITDFGRSMGRASVRVWDEKPPEKKKKAAPAPAAQ
ncbi:MAG: hypothetical protein HY362_04455 [Candidatus Aenigmarchaeota archaeon]|nr:hypothetical protein [Candidatus Aenigmarchaeota archaeon]